MAIRIFPRLSAVPGDGLIPARTGASGLIAAYLPLTETGALFDVTGNGPPLVSATCVRGTGGYRATAAGTGAVGNAPARYKLALPITVLCRLRFVGTPSVNAVFFGVSYDNAGTSPFAGYQLGTNAAGELRVAYNSGGTFQEWNGLTFSRTPASFGNKTITMGAVLATAGPTIYFDADEGVTQSVASSNPTYGTTPLVRIGVASVAANVIVEYGLIYNRRLAPMELREFRLNPYAWLQPVAARSGRFAVGSAGAAPATATAQAYVWGPV